MENYKFTSWDGKYCCLPDLFLQPSSVEEIREILIRAKRENRRVKVCGSHHSFSSIACTKGCMINLQKLDRVLDIDCNKKTIRVEAGMTLCHLAEHILPENGLALSVISITSAQSLAGAISTCTHGTGAGFPMMASYIIDIDIMTSSGDLVRCSRYENLELFSAACCGLGALGVIVSATIQCEEAFNLHETLTPMKFDQVITNLDEHVNSGDHVQFLWLAHTDDIVISRASRTKLPVTTPQKSSWFWGTLIQYHVFQTLYWLSDSLQSMVPWINKAYNRLFWSSPIERVDTSHRIFTMPVPIHSSNEWAVPMEKSAEALQKLKGHMDVRQLYAHQPVLIRFTKSDDIMLSPSFGRNVCYINIVHNTPYGNRSPNLSTWGVFQDVMRSVGGIPHWGKTEELLTSAEYEKLLPRWKEFCEIRKKVDPEGMFLNDFLEKSFKE